MNQLNTTAIILTRTEYGEAEKSMGPLRQAVARAFGPEPALLRFPWEHLVMPALARELRSGAVNITRQY